MNTTFTTPSEYAIVSTTPVLIPESVERDDDGTAWGTIMYDNGEVDVCRLLLRFDQNGWLHDKKGRPAVVAQTNVRHTEHRRGGLLHRWSGPALVHGTTQEYWLYGVCFPQEVHAFLASVLVENNCNCDAGQYNHVAAYFDEYAFIDQCFERHQAPSNVELLEAQAVNERLQWENERMREIVAMRDVQVQNCFRRIDNLCNIRDKLRTENAWLREESAETYEIVDSADAQREEFQ